MYWFISIFSIGSLKATLLKVEKCLQIPSRPLPPSEKGVAATQYATISDKMMK